MKGGQPATRALCAAVFLLLGGCAIGGASQTMTAPVAERDLLVEAARDVERTKWRAPEPAPVLAWITGGDDDRFTKSDAVAFYVNILPAAGRFNALLADADRKMADAERFHVVAVNAAAAPRVSTRDIALVEECIRALREQRDIYTAAAKKLEAAGDPVDDEQVDQMRRRFSNIVRALGDAADDLADRHAHTRSATFATPSRVIAGNSPEL